MNCNTIEGLEIVRSTITRYALYGKNVLSHWRSEGRVPLQLCDWSMMSQTRTYAILCKLTFPEIPAIVQSLKRSLASWKSSSESHLEPVTQISNVFCEAQCMYELQNRKKLLVFYYQKRTKFLGIMTCSKLASTIVINRDMWVCGALDPKVLQKRNFSNENRYAEISGNAF